MYNIIFLEDVLSYGGARKSTVELASRLNTYMPVKIFDINGSCHPFINACQDAKVDIQVLDPKNSPLILSSNSVFQRLYNYLYYFFYVIKVNRIISKTTSNDEQNLFVLNNSRVLMFLLKKPRNAQIALFARGWFTHRQISRIDRFLYKKLVDRFICVSESTRQAIYGAGLADMKSLFVVHNAIEEQKLNTKVYVDGNGKECLKILLSGGFLPSKGHQTAIEIAKALKDKGITFKMILTGIIYESPASSVFYEKIKGDIISLGLTDVVETVVNKHDVIEYFRWCDVFIHPSSTEGLPRVIMEALILKKAVVANAVGGVTDYILDGFTGIIVNYNNVDDYVSGILKLWNNKELYRKITENGYSLVKECFSAERQIEAMRRAMK